MKISGAEAIIKTFMNHDVDVIFGYPGGAIMPFYDALSNYTHQIHHVLVRHEQGAAHAAEGYARISGKIGVCIATSGPGATNLITGIADAMLDSIPLVSITGQVASGFIGTDAFQEVDVMSITTPITKWNYQIRKVEEIPNIISKAFFIAATGRPGPVLIDVPKDIQSKLFNYSPGKIKYDSPKKITTKMNLKIKIAANLINHAQRPFMLIGHGALISKAENEILSLAEKADIPVASTLHGLSAFPGNHQLFTGMLGMHGNYAPNILTNQADVILALGMRFDDRVTGRIADYAKQAKIIHIDIDQSELNKNVKVEIDIHRDLKEILRSLIPLVKKESHSKWKEKFIKLYQKEKQKIISKEISPSKGMLKMAEIIHQISQKTNGQAIIIADVGQHQMITARYYQFRKPNSFLTSGGAGTMGYALPAAIGAKIANPKRQVIAIIGDGSFQMTIQELATINQEKLDIKIVILNNNYLGMVRQWQELFFDHRYSFVKLQNPNFTIVAKGFGISGEKITTRKKLSKALDTMLTNKGAYLLDIIVKQEENVFPMIATGASVGEIRLE